MVYNYEYENDIKVKVWIDELPISKCKSVEILRREYKAAGQGLNNRQIVVELQLPKNISNYGMLGVKYQNHSSDANIVINISKYDEEIYEENIAIKPDIVHHGIPRVYADGIIKSIEHNKAEFLACGVYEFNIGAHGEVGSSEQIFTIITNILLKLLCANYIPSEAAYRSHVAVSQSINNDIVKKVINSELI